MSWIKLLIASVFEVGWVVGLTHADTFVEWVGTVIAIFMSFYLLINASQKLPVGTSYAVFVGLGATGVTIMDMVVFDEPFHLVKVILIAVLVSAVMGLKFVTTEEVK